ncbi:hypothetical protein NQ317_002235 [Molorchus minor]|uniref:Uncharacterized protein n=1 Tax=Molorchus minor TaxID=1323400 RepID=A0ABQ9JDA7_9CUCU|nr:hypothetical protein NQ317_002235 [Molorchus minor]
MNNNAKQFNWIQNKVIRFTWYSIYSGNDSRASLQNAIRISALQDPITPANVILQRISKPQMMEMYDVTDYKSPDHVIFRGYNIINSLPLPRYIRSWLLAHLCGFRCAFQGYSAFCGQVPYGFVLPFRASGLWDMRLVSRIELSCQPHTFHRVHNITGIGEEFYTLRAIRTGRFKKGGIPDCIAAARSLLEDWNKLRITCNLNYPNHIKEGTMWKKKYHTLPPEENVSDVHISSSIVSEVL